MAIIRQEFDMETGVALSEPEVTFSGLVVESLPCWYHVPSDSAMLDSGRGYKVTVWDGDHFATTTYRLGRPSPFRLIFEVDAPERLRKLLTLVNYLRSWIEEIKSNLSYRLIELESLQRHPPVGARVEVFKGRKVPLGIYYVCHSATGDYGPYVNLGENKLGLGGKYYTYVASGNCRLVDDPETVLGPVMRPTPPFEDSTLLDRNGARLWSLFLANAKGGDNWHAIADCLDDLGADDWAEAARALFNTPPAGSPF